MKIVIEVPECYYSACKDWQSTHIATVAECIIAYGTPLVGHGRLIDADAYRKDMLNSREFDFFKTLDMQPTIIEADKER